MIWQVSRYTSTQWTSEFDDALQASGHVNSLIHVEANVMWTQRHTWRPSSSKCGDGLEGHNYANLVAMTKQVWRWTLTRKSCELRDAHGGQYVVNMEMQLQAMIKQVSGHTLRPWSNKLQNPLQNHDCTSWLLWLTKCGNSVGVRDRSGLEYIGVVDMVAVDWETQ